MAKIIFDGWSVGMQKIPFIKLLNGKAGLSFAEAKNIKDRLIDNSEIIYVEITDENLAKEILEEAKKLKVKGRIESHPAGPDLKS